MDTTMRSGTAQRRLVAGAVNVNVAGVRIDLAAAIETRLQTFEPKNARGDGSQREALPGVAGKCALFEIRSNRPTAADFFRDAMESARRHVRAGNFADAKFGSGATQFFYEPEIFSTTKTRRREGFFKKRNGLFRDVHGENEARWNDATLLAASKKNLSIIHG